MLGFLLQLQFSILYAYFHSHKALLVFGGITFLLPLYVSQMHNSICTVQYFMVYD